MDSRSRVQSIDRAVAILKCFSEKRKEIKLSDIAEELDLNKSTVHGIISTLKYHGLIDQDEDTQKYRLGLHLLELGSIVRNSFKINEIAKPYINEICNKIGETVHLGTLDNKEVVYLEKAETQQSMRIVTNIGSRLPAYCTGIGKVMLAYRYDDLLNLLPDTLEKYSANTITNKSLLIEEFKKIKEQGYALDKEEHSVGLSCVAAPIFDNNRRVKFGISVSGPTIRMTGEKIEKAIIELTNAALEISYKLGYRD